jgi:membrane protein implicated in regulation of membrane protease activity
MYAPTMLWLVTALIALGIEFLTGTLYLLVVSLALAGGGLCAWLGASGSLQFIAASLCGVVAYLIVSRWKRRVMQPTNHQADNPDLGQEVRIERITAPGLARVFYRGTEWDARFDGTAPEIGAQAIITGHDGNHLTISSSIEEAKK